MGGWMRGWGEREGVGAGGEMTQALYAHINNKTIKKIGLGSYVLMIY
jgi:hypothetical protein